MTTMPPTSDGTVSRLGRIRQLLELIRFSHTVFALPFALLAAVLAWREPENGFAWYQLGGIVLGMVTARSAAMAFNRLVDRRLDAENPRTANRHLPAGLLGVGSVWLFTLICSLGFLASTLLFLLGDPPNWWPIRLAVPVLLFLLGYSYVKRFSSLCHYWLAAALMLSPLCVWIAIRGPLIGSAEDLAIPGMLAAVIFFWVGGFDIIYACQDVEHDRRAGLFSVPARLGVPAALRVAMVSHLVTIGCLFGLWMAAGLGPVFLCGVVAVSVLLAWEHWLVRPEDLSRVGLAFFHINAVISLGLLAVGLADVLLFPLVAS
ncbi:MAG TPA: 4-hydroxybenzoate octaprenyltransferase [Planctomycetaceae bacterium]|nr:4-hydroxybenzoate octaprenyltransferase [Planctomycetaceae bacterium]|tara:strand:+ start:890 stop:1843 length:954 start_codon:yes stop_codon:yes gene_type:complete